MDIYFYVMNIHSNRSTDKFTNLTDWYNFVVRLTAIFFFFF